MTVLRTLKRARRSGYTLLAVVVFLGASLALVSVNQRRLTAMVQIERARLAADDFSEGPAQAMAKALALLETGLPPSNPYVCGVALTTSSGTRSFAVLFISSGGH